MELNEVIFIDSLPKIDLHQLMLKLMNLLMTIYV